MLGNFPLLSEIANEKNTLLFQLECQLQKKSKLLSYLKKL